MRYFIKPLLWEVITVCILVWSAISCVFLHAQSPPTNIPATPRPLWLPDADFPQNGQFFPRDSAGLSASLCVGGILYADSVKSAYLLVFKNNLPYKQCEISLPPLAYNIALNAIPTERRFYAECSIGAECSSYSFKLGFRTATWDSVVAARDSLICGDVLLVSGQSNTVLGKPLTPLDGFGRTFLDTNGVIIPYGYDQQMRNPVWVSTRLAQSKGYTMGGLALGVQQQIHQGVNIPLCIMHGGVNATTIEQHFADTNANTRVKPNNIYGNLYYRSEQAMVRHAARSLVWYQGESNSDARHYDSLFYMLHYSWMQDYPNLEHIYVVQIHASMCMNYDQHKLKEAQRQLARTLPNITLISSNAVPFHDGCHYKDSGYVVLAEQISRHIAHDFYHSRDAQHLHAPNIELAFWLDSAHCELMLSFSHNPLETQNMLAITADTSVGGKKHTIAEAFSFDDETGAHSRTGSIADVRPAGFDSVILTLHEPHSSAHYISYAHKSYYANSPGVVYQGPWIVNSRGIGALSFNHVYILPWQP